MLSTIQRRQVAVAIASSSMASAAEILAVYLKNPEEAKSGSEHRDQSTNIAFRCKYHLDHRSILGYHDIQNPVLIESYETYTEVAQAQS